MAGRLQDRVLVITGGGNGIGAACALRFAEEGAKVVVGDLQGDAVDASVAAVEAAGGEAAGVITDVTSRVDCDALAQTAIDRFGRLDGVVTAAGISHANYVSGDTEGELKHITQSAEQEDRARAFVDLELEAYQRVQDVNTLGTLLTIQACVARMLDLGSGGSVITIASIAAKNPTAGPLPYVISKAGVWMMTKKLAVELAPAGIRVNSIGPGFIQTHMTAFIDMVPEIEEMLLERVPMGRRGQPVDIANAALFLASDESVYFTGEILHPDGGFFTE